MPKKDHPDIPKRDIYAVKVEVDIFVLAQNSKEAIKTARENAKAEIEEFGSGSSKLIQRKADIPNAWIDTIPYTPYGALDEDRTCRQIMDEIISVRNEKSVKSSKEEILDDEDMKAVIKIHNEVAQKVIEDKSDDRVIPETRPDPKPPKELDWNESRKDSPPPVRFLK